MTINMKRGAFRLWAVVTVLWVGVVGWSWSEAFVGARDASTTMGFLGLRLLQYRRQRPENCSNPGIQTIGRRPRLAC